MHFLKASPFGLVSMYRKNRDHHCGYHPVAGIGGRSLEPAAMIGCSKGGFIDKYVRDPNKTLDSSQQPPHNCPRCGNPVDGLYCRHCALLRKKLKEVWFTICDEHKFFQDFLNTFESSNNDSNVVGMPQEPLVFNQNPGENSSQSPPQIDHYCCYGCGNSLDEPCHDQNIEEFPQTLPSSHPTCYSRDKNSFAYDLTSNLVKDSLNVFNPSSQPPMYSYEFCGDDAHYSYDCPPQVPFIYDSESCYNQDFNFPQNFQSFQQQYPCCENCGGRMKLFNKIPICYDDDDDEESSIPLRNIIISELPSCIAITPVVSTKDSLSMGDEYLDTIPEKESDEFIKSSFGNLVPNPSESEDECECDVPDCDDFQTTNFSTFSNPLFDDSTSSDDESSHEEVIHKMSFKTYSNPLFYLDDEIISSEFNLIYNEDLDSTLKNDRFDTKYYLPESLLNRDTLMASSPKFDSLLEELFGELAHTDLIPPRINEADFDPEEDIYFVERLLYDNSSPRPPEEFNSKNFDAIIEFFSPSPIPVEDSDPFMEEIKLFLASDGSIPLGIDSDYSDSEGDNLFLERLLHDDPIPFPDTLDFSNVV
nr:hypothetical protein [Tanacetum cinerariifolium]